MKFSIIIPIYKVEKYLQACVDSVLSQTFKDYEVILVDDGSPDNCPQMCDEYAARNTSVKVIHQTNAGIACARNIGINEATGEYILCIDSDDYLTSSTILQELVENIKAQPDVILLGYIKYFENNDRFGSAKLPGLEKKADCVEMLNKELKANTYGGAAWTKVVRTQLLHENGIYFKPGMVSAEDSDWFMNIMLHAKSFESFRKPVVVYRQRPDSVSHSPKVASLIDILWIAESWSEKINGIKDNERLKKALLAVMAYYYANYCIIFSSYPNTISKHYKIRFKKQAYLLDYAITPRANIVRKFYKILGFDITVFLLRILSLLKTRQ